MAQSTKGYRVVDQLPANAMTVRAYADSIGQTVTNIYQKHARGKLEIISFSGVNFVIPKTEPDANSVQS